MTVRNDETAQRTIRTLGDLCAMLWPWTPKADRNITPSHEPLAVSRQVRY
jgi:hypothetical protein